MNKKVRDWINSLDPVVVTVVTDEDGNVIHADWDKLKARIKSINEVISNKNESELPEKN